MDSQNSIYKKIILLSVALFLVNEVVQYYFLIYNIQGDKFYTQYMSNYFFVVTLLTAFAWFFLTFLFVKLLKKQSQARNQLEQYNEHLDEMIEQKTQKHNTLLEAFDKNVIASRTDVNGRITYASKAYEEISGYTQEELIGSSHNIVRHPDMPKEVFKELWQTIKSGQTWCGEVKNLRKDGTSYWVYATITPYYENGELVGYNAIREDITAKKDLEKLNETLEQKVQNRTQEIENQLYTDRLTGLLSYQALTRDIEDSAHTFITLMLINIDNFKNINGLYGFESGNNILKEFAQTLKPFETKRGYKLYRIYADEFVMFKDCDFSNIDEYYEDLINLKQIIQNKKFFIQNINNAIHLNATIGVSLGQDDPLVTVDMALRHAKEHRLDFQAYNTTIDIKHKLQNTLEWKEKIAQGLIEDRFIPVFQPIVNTNQEIIKYEVLTRLRKSIEEPHVLQNPGEFLEESINTKQYNDITKAVLTQTFEIMKTCDKLFSINISYEDIYNYVLIDFLEENFKKDESIAKRLVIEILEDQEIKNLEVMTDFIKKFKSYGVKIAIDDFGIGHSNLSHIMDIEPDYLKIDGSFIKDIATDKKSFALTKSVVEFCKELDIIVIAEYVHNKETFEIVHKLGIDEFQGYYFSPPLENI